MTTIVLTAAMLLACVPASASVLTLNDNNTHDLNSAVAEDDVEVYNSTTANLLTGGSIGRDMYSYYNSTVTVTGGSIGGYLDAFDDSTVIIFGTFDIFGYGVYADGDPLDSATLTGTLADGTAFNNQVRIYQSATVTLAAPAAVPEPSSIAMFGIGALGLFGYGRRRRQTSAAA